MSLARSTGAPHARRIVRFAGIVPLRGAARPADRSPRSARLVEWGEGDDQPVEVRITGCPGRRLRVSLVGQIDNACDLARELSARRHGLAMSGDAEVIAHAYEEWGEACIERLYGTFALALWDESASALLLARDRIGVRTLFYREADGCLAFGSHLAALREMAEIPWEVDPRAIDSFLALGAVPAPLSICRSVSKLPAGQALSLKGSTVELKPYWSIAFRRERRRDISRAEEEFRALFRDAVQRMVDREPSGVMLSGGPDSAIILAVLADLNRPAPTFTFAFAGGYDELEAARRTARHFHAENHAFRIEPCVGDALPALARQYQEPHGRTSALAWYFAQRSLRDHVRVLLSGDGADEVFSGRDRSLVVGPVARLHGLPGGRTIAAAAAGLAAATRYGEPLRRVLEGAELAPEDRYAHWLSTFSPPARAALYSRDFARRIGDDPVRRLVARLVAGSVSPHDQAFAVDVGLWLPEVGLATFDTADPGRVEVRAPFLDHRIIELAASFSPALRVRWRTSKRFLRKVYATRLPAWLHETRRKGGASLPVGQLLRKELYPWLEECLLSPAAMQRGYFEPAAVRRLVEEHVQGKADRATQLWSLLMLELWHRQWVDR